MTEPTHTRVGYQPALDGIRAVAVLAVVLYHSGVPWMSGGFLGVDGFFVVSGFLITTLLLDEFAATGCIDISGFWLRRIRRLVPAVLVLALAVTAWAVFVDPEWAESLSGDVIAALSYVSNWRFILDERSYFEVFGSPSPLRHTWSLAIEEQWYVLWPLLVAGVLGAARTRRATMPMERLVLWCAAGCMLLAVVSAAWMARLASDGADISRLYYGTDTRAQALLVGAALGFAGWERLGTATGSPGISLRLIALSGIGAAGAVVLALVVVVDIDAWLYTGGFLLIALAWSSVVAAATNGVPGPIRRLLGTAPFVAVGRLSYGIYLWHWPVQLIVSPARVGGSLAALTVLRLVVTFALAGASYALIENPVRLRRWLPTPRALLVGVGAATTSVLAVTVLLGGVETTPEPQIATAHAAPSSSVAPVTTQAPPPVHVNPVSPDPIPLAAVAPAPEEEEEAAAPTNVVVVGDSVAFVMGYYRGQVEGVSVDNRGQMGCGVIPDELWVGNRRIQRAAACERWLDDWANVNEGDVVLAFIGSWEVFDPHVDGARLVVGSERWSERLTAQLQQGVDAVAKSGGHLALASVPCYDTIGMVGEIPSTERDDPARVAAVNAVMRAVAEANTADVSLIDWADFACPNDVPRTLANGQPLRPDGIHTDIDTTPVVWEWLAAELSALAASLR